MRFIITAIFPLFFCLNSRAQPGFIKTYDFGLNAALFTNLLVNHDTLIGCAIGQSLFPPYNGGIVFTKMDTFGNSYLTRFHMAENNYSYVVGDTPSGFIQLSDKSGYLYLGGIFEIKGVMVIKLDNDGEIVWKKIYEAPNSLVNWIHEVVETEDGYLIGGSRQKRNYDLDQLIMKIDKKGSLKWLKLYGGIEYNERTSNIIKINENEFVVSGGGGNDPTLGNALETYKKIFTVDSTGNVKWAWETIPEEDATLDNLMRVSDDIWIHTTVEGVMRSDGFYETQPKVVFRDTNFKVVEEKIYDTPAIGNYFYSMIPVSSGGWLAVGQDQVQLTRNGNQENHRMARMVRLDEQGDTIWTRTDLVFRDSNFVSSLHDLHSVVELSSGSFVAAGHFLRWVYPRDLGFLIKVDKNGCLDTINCRLTSSSSYMKELSNDISVYPNPATEQINFSFGKRFQEEKNKTILFTDLTGKIIEKKQIPDGQNLFVWSPEQLPSGIYFYRVESQGEVIHAGKLVWKL